jgi:putative ABC transport system ATP-binding protein
MQTMQTNRAMVTEAAARSVELTKIYGSGETMVVALDAVDVAFARGAFTAIMGPSGSGKSTLLHVMAGLDGPTSGRVLLGDIDISALDDTAITKLRRDRLGFVFQAFNLVPQLTAAENITLPLALARRSPDAGWFDEVVDSLGLRERLSHTPAELSGGQQQRVAVARAMITKPDVIFADEPTGNLDSTSRGEVLRILRTSVDAMAQTVVMVTHDAVAAAHADRVLFLADGRVVDELDDPTADRILDHLKALGG